MKYLPRHLSYFMAGLGAIALIILAFRPSPIQVDLGEAKRGTLLVTVDEEGKTRIRSRFVVSTPVAGRLNRIELDEGDRVKQSSVIARIDPLPLNSQVREVQAKLREWQAERAGVVTQRPKQEALLQAQARIRAAQAQQREAQAKVEQVQASLAQAKRDHIRAQRLAADGAISRQELESAQLLEITRTRELEVEQREAESAAAEVVAAREELSILRAEQRDPDYMLDVYDARIASAEAELARLADDAARTEIKSPVDGEVLRVLQESARHVEAGTPLLELGNPEQIEVVVDLLSTDAVKVKSGTKVLIEHWGGEQTLEAKVNYIEPSAFTEISALGVEEQRVNVIAEFINSSVPLGDGYRVEARIVIWEGHDMLIVPLSSLFRCEQAWCVFVVEDGRAKKRQVEISKRSDFEAVIQQGLELGEVVILHPTEEIEDNKRVAPR
ncbi:MAG: efflux RND transporter periplasmic adaptor subunit [Symploca sp. SIO3C6]|nr:efflux RND transporter periplasmic adaptor subunit [Symploca sp. SIO3C6]